MDGVRTAVLKMLIAAGFPYPGLVGPAGLDATAPDGVGGASRLPDWRYHRRRWELMQCLAMLDRLDDPEACWITTGHRAASGHAVCSKKGLGTTSMSRQVYMVTSGVYGLGDLVVRHTCWRGSHGCCRPEHLLAGSRRANAQDEVLRRRGQRIAGRRTEDLLHMDVLDVAPTALRALADAEAYIARLQPVGNGCLAVDASLADHYRRVTIAGRRWALHRYVLSHVLGRRLEQYALHGCMAAGAATDRKQCVVHLSEGSLSLNSRQAVERGQIRSGVLHPRSVFADAKVPVEICALHAAGWTTRAIADRVEVPVWNVWRVIAGETHVDSTGQPRRASKVYLSNRGVRVWRALASAGVALATVEQVTGHSKTYLIDLLAHGQRPKAGGPRVAPPGRARGERVGNAQLGRRRAAVARQRVQHGESRAAVARDMGVSPTTIERALLEATWAGDA
jgi:hypothetical protein